MKLWDLFLRRLRRRTHTLTTTHRGRRFRPAILDLEDRTVPAGTDMFADATVLTGTFATDSGDNLGASAEDREVAPLPAAEPINSVWWQWTAPANGLVEVNTLGSGLDTVLGVWTGDAVNALTLVDANDDFFDAQSRVSFQATAGTTYHISVDGFSNLTGAIVLNLAMAPVNDNFADATAIGFGTVTGNNTGATAEPGEPSGAGTSGAINSVWWKWTAASDGTIDVNTLGSELDTVLAVYTGSSLDTLQLLVSNDDIDFDNQNFQSEVTFDAAAGTTYYIAVDGSLDFTGGIVLSVSDVTGPANHPPVIEPGQSFSLNENSFGGTFVGRVAASDPDQGQTLTYAITAGNTDNAFSINQATGDIFVDNGEPLDFETNPTFSLTVTVTDSGTPELSVSDVVTVNLINLHDPPIFQDVGPFSVAENSPAGTSVGTVTATDPDPGQTVTFAITGGNTGGAFAINATTGEITVADPTALDFETTPEFVLTVTATDNDTPAQSSSASVVVFLDDGNDPPVIADQTFFLDENSAVGTNAANVVASDPDAGQTLTYAIVGGNASGAFAIDSLTGRIRVADSAPLDFETTPTFVLTVQVTDSGNPALSSTAAVTIKLNDVNEAATFVSAGPFNVDENVAAGTVVGTVVAVDPDGGQTLSYAITGGNTSGAFAIDPDTGVITVVNAAALDFETHPSFTLTVRASDDGSPVIRISTSVVVTLNDVNDAPVLDNSGTMSLATINQGDFANSGTLVSAILASAGGVRVTDQDAGAVQGIAVVAANTANGTWQYSTDGGATWCALGDVSDTSARLLAADALTRVRFVPAAGFNGTVTNGITFRAWDQTSGANGGLADTTANGGTTAFSTAVETAGIKVRSALEQIALLTTDVRNLMNAGELSNNDGNQLLSKLGAAKKHLDQGNPTPAANQMNLFINLVTNFVQSGDLDPSLGDDLVAKAQAVIVSMQN